MKKDPRIYLAIDNCFASKRWTSPNEWMKVIHEIGIRYVEASADTECDPLYMGTAFIRDWIWEVKQESKSYGIEVINLYSGHGTYSTLGLSHYDSRVRERFRDNWLKTQADTAKVLGAGLGFFAHAFSDRVLQDHGLYRSKLAELYTSLADLAVYAQQIDLRSISVEQMYAPHQPPWTIAGTKELLREVYMQSGTPFYITIDLGHANGQKNFQMPTSQGIFAAIAAKKRQESFAYWIGSASAMSLLESAVQGNLPQETAVEDILKDCAVHPHLFAKQEDACVYHWLEKLGAWSPIIHLQQSDGKSSPHWPFDPTHNAKGIISGERVIASLRRAFDSEESGLPPMCDEVVLTLEPFISTDGNVYCALDELRQSVCYWRQFVPEDGMRLSEIITATGIS